MKDFVNRFKSLPVNTKRLLSLGVIVALVVALPLFVWAIINFTYDIREKAASGEPVDIAFEEPFKGPSDAIITIVVYSDFQCPFCKNFVDNTLQTILNTYPTQVKYVYKDFPILSLHPLAERAAIVGQCAFKQGKFWEMHDLLFAKQTTLTEADFTDFANQIGLNFNQYNQCYLNKTTLPEVQDDMTEGNFKGVVGTPTFFVNGIKLEGDQPFSEFKAIIDGLIGTTAPTPTDSPAPADSPSPTATSSPTTAPTQTPTAGDVNQDGVVNIVDMGIVIDHYGETNPTYENADINDNNVVDVVDLGIVISNY